MAAATIGAAMSFSSVAAAQPAPQDEGYAAPPQAQEIERTGENNDGLWGLFGLAGLLGLFGLLRRPPRRDQKNALAGHPAEHQPRIPDANGAYTPPGGQPIPPQVRNTPLPGGAPAPGSGELASEKPLRRWP
nr:WGxxGxxG family protein [Amycolatopsis marina]